MVHHENYDQFHSEIILTLLSFKIQLVCWSISEEVE